MSECDAEEGLKKRVCVVRVGQKKGGPSPPLEEEVGKCLFLRGFEARKTKLQYFSTTFDATVESSPLLVGVRCLRASESGSMIFHG